MIVTIMSRDSKANTKKLGTITWDGKRVIFDVPPTIKKFLRTIRVNGKEYTPTSKKYVEMLPHFLWGDRLWATVPR